MFDGLVFPKTLLPPETLENPTTDDLVKIVQQEQELLTEIMKKNGAIILRGFGLSSADDFSRVVEATGWEEFTYRGAVVRKRPAPRVFTANEAPLEFNIGFHHEMALIKVYPNKLIIFCETPSPEGGQTAIIRSDVVVQRMEELMPDVVEKLEREGIRFFHVRQKDTWQRLIGVDDPVEAEKEAIEKLHYCNAFKYNEADGSAEIHYGPIFPIRELDGKRVMFNTIIGYVTEQMPLNATYGDGTPIPPEVVETYTNILAENCVDLNWENGDIVIVNNLLCQHARRAGKPPRAVMVSVAN